MVSIVSDNKLQDMIDNYESMPYVTFKRLLAACETAEDDTQRTVSVLSILTGKSEDEILNLPIAEYGRLAQIAQFIGTAPHNVPVRAEYKLGDFTLVPVIQIKNMTAGQFIDFQQYVKDDNLDIELLSCLLVPKGHKYMDGYDIEDIHKTLRQHLLTRDAIALKSFFTVSSVASLPSILTSSEEVRKKLTRKQRREMRRAARVMRSLKDGAGSLSLMQYQRLIDAAGRPLPL